MAVVFRDPLIPYVWKLEFAPSYHVNLRILSKGLTRSEKE